MKPTRARGGEEQTDNEEKQKNRKTRNRNDERENETEKDGRTRERKEGEKVSPGMSSVLRGWIYGFLSITIADPFHILLVLPIRIKPMLFRLQETGQSETSAERARCRLATKTL